MAQPQLQDLLEAGVEQEVVGLDERRTADAEIESWHGTRAVVISSCASTYGDELLVQLMTDDNNVVAWTATVMACEPIVGRPAARYRVTLSLTPAHSPAHAEGVPVE